MDPSANPPKILKEMPRQTLSNLCDLGDCGRALRPGPAGPRPHPGRALVTCPDRRYRLAAGSCYFVVICNATAAHRGRPIDYYVIRLSDFRTRYYPASHPDAAALYHDLMAASCGPTSTEFDALAFAILADAPHRELVTAMPNCAKAVLDRITNHFGIRSKDLYVPHTHPAQ